MAMGAFVALAVAICVLWLGLYEGGYNHGIKNLAFMAQLPATVLNAVFPPSLYEPPGDWFFEFSGVLQLRSVCLRDEWRGEHTQHPEGHDVARPQQDIASHRCVLILSASDPRKRPAPSPQLDERHPLGHRDAPIARLG